VQAGSAQRAAVYSAAGGGGAWPKGAPLFLWMWLSGECAAHARLGVAQVRSRDQQWQKVKEALGDIDSDSRVFFRLQPTRLSVCTVLFAASKGVDLLRQYAAAGTDVEALAEECGVDLAQLRVETAACVAEYKATESKSKRAAAAAPSLAAVRAASAKAPPLLHIEVYLSVATRDGAIVVRLAPELALPPATSTTTTTTTPTPTAAPAPVTGSASAPPAVCAAALAGEAGATASTTSSSSSTSSAASAQSQLTVTPPTPVSATDTHTASSQPSSRSPSPLQDASRRLEVSSSSPSGERKVRRRRAYHLALSVCLRATKLVGRSTTSTRATCSTTFSMHLRVSRCSR
jgi:hypothetical protein